MLWPETRASGGRNRPHAFEMRKQKWFNKFSNIEGKSGGNSRKSKILKFSKFSKIFGYFDEKIEEKIVDFFENLFFGSVRGKWGAECVYLPIGHLLKKFGKDSMLENFFIRCQSRKSRENLGEILEYFEFFKYFVEKIVDFFSKIPSEKIFFKIYLSVRWK